MRVVCRESKFEQLDLSVKGHAEPLVWLRVAPRHLVDRPIGKVLVALRLLLQLRHVRVAADFCRAVQIKNLGDGIIRGRAYHVLGREPSRVVHLGLVVQRRLGQG